MNRQIVKLFGFIVVLFAVLVGFTSYWSVFDAKALKEKEANKRPLLEQQQIRRGRILAADGTVIAKSVAEGPRRRAALRPPLPRRGALRPPDRLQLRAPGRLRVRAVPQRRTGRRRIGIRLDPRRAAPGTSRKATTSSPTSTRRRSGSRSNDLEEAGFGAVVAIEPSTGAVKVMASNPPYDPNRVPYELEKLNHEQHRNAAVQPRHPGPATRRARPSRS